MRSCRCNTSEDVAFVDGLNIRTSRAAIIVALLVVAGSVGLAAPAGGRQAAPGITIASWSWEASDATSWSAYTVRVRNTTDRVFSGEMVLVPSDSGRGAIYRMPVRFEPNSEMTVSLPLSVTDVAYQAEIHDRSGRRLAQGEPVAAQVTGRDWVGLLSDIPAGASLLLAGSRLPFLVSRRFSSGRDFPSDAAMLRGLKMVVIADFDSASLNPEQVKALRDFVGLGGSLVVGGGPTWERTVPPLPDDLAPLRPDSTRTASLAPVADLAAMAGGGSAMVAAGQLRGGRSVLEGPEHVPLVVERTLGSGRVVQVAYDLLGGVDRTDPVIVLGRDQALVRAGIGPPVAPGSQPAATAPGAEPAAAWSILEPAGAPPGLPLGAAAAALLAYALAVGPLSDRLLGHRGEVTLLWIRVPVMALVVTGVFWGAIRGPWRSTLVQHEVQVRRSAPDGTAQVDSYHLLRSNRRGAAHVELSPGGLASLVPRPDQARRLPETASAVGLRTPGRAVVTKGGGQVRLGRPTRVDLGAWPKWGTRMLRTSSVDRSLSPGLEIQLRLVGGRLTGTVANKGAGPIQHLRVKAADGTGAELAARLAPGASVDVATALLAQGGGAAPAGTAGALLDLAGRTRPHSGLLNVFGLVSTPSGLSADGGRREGPRMGLLVTTARLSEADTVSAGLGTPRLVCVCSAANDLAVYDFELPSAAVGSLGLVARADDPATPGAVEVFNWASGTWRLLLPAAEEERPAALGTEEIRDGTARVRVREHDSRTEVKVMSS